MGSSGSRPASSSTPTPAPSSKTRAARHRSSAPAAPPSRRTSRRPKRMRRLDEDGFERGDHLRWSRSSAQPRARHMANGATNTAMSTDLPCSPWNFLTQPVATRGSEFGLFLRYRGPVTGVEPSTFDQLGFHVRPTDHCDEPLRVHGLRRIVGSSDPAGFCDGRATASRGRPACLRRDGAILSAC